MVTNFEPRLNELLSVTYEIGRYVSAHSAWRARGLGGDGAVMSFEGDILLERVPARLAFSIRPEWRRSAPLVYCAAPWIRRETEWHVYSNGGLCWIFEPYWRAMLDECAGFLNECELRRTAAFWCASASSDLVGKHLFADTHGIKNWPKGWDAWAHGPDALLQLKNMKASGEFQRKAQDLRRRAKAAKALALSRIN